MSFSKTKHDYEIYWHTTSLILAQAVKRLLPETKLGVGSNIEKGFYYDFDPKVPFTKENLPKIEKEMNRIIKEALPITKKQVEKAKAKEFFKKRGEIYKIQILEKITDEFPVTLYSQGEFTDLCKGPHLTNTKDVAAFKLINTTGAYWLGSENNKMLSRIYGISFKTQKELDGYFLNLEKVKKFDHKKLGKDLEFFMNSEIVGQGLPILLPKGAKILQLLQRFVEDNEEKHGFSITKTPYMSKPKIFEISGHWQHYKENMFILGEDKSESETMTLRPMTCPYQFQVFLNKTRSWRDLPMKLFETSTCFRNEASGEMHGLARLRQFTLSDSHIICMPEQLKEEFEKCIILMNMYLKKLKLIEYVYYRLSLWDPENKEKYIGSEESWNKVQDKMKEILDEIGMEYSIGYGEAAFYGPKLDVQIKNIHGKEDTLITIQIDFQSAERFEMTYIDKNNKRQTPIVIHRSAIGCYERTLAFMIENYKGIFPLWLAPIQVVIIPVNLNRHSEYAKNIANSLENSGITRILIDLDNEKMGYKIRKHEAEKIPYILVVGDKELQNTEVSVRKPNKKNTEQFALRDFIKELIKEN